MNLNQKILFLFLVFGSLFELGCLRNNECEKYENEEFSISQFKKVDSLFTETELYRTKYNKKDLRALEFEKYRLVSKPSLGNVTTIIEYEKRESDFKMIYEIYLSNDSTNDIALNEKTEVTISEFDWNYIDFIIYNYNFWTTNPEIINMVADGHGYILEGVRPDAKKCDKISSKIIVRGSPGYNDKIGWLCDDFHRYSIRLKEISKIE